MPHFEIEEPDSWLSISFGRGQIRNYLGERISFRIKPVNVLCSWFGFVIYRNDSIWISADLLRRIYVENRKIGNFQWCPSLYFEKRQVVAYLKTKDICYSYIVSEIDKENKTCLATVKKTTF